MMAYPPYVLEVFQWLIRSSFQATILLGFILVIRIAVQKKLRFRTVYWLWMLLLLRLVWPLNVQTTYSVFNLLPPQAEPGHYFSKPAAEERSDAIPLSGDTLVSPFVTSDLPVQTVPSNSSAGDRQTYLNRTPPPGVAAKSFLFDWRQSFCTVWLAGVILMGGYVLFCNFRLWRIVTSQRLVTRQDILDLLEDCKAHLGLQTVIGVVETDNVKTPCLFGYLRPRLLLPAGTLKLSGQQLRYVFIHELAHLKRHDIFVGWLMAVVQVLHWFNPAVWFAMTQISSDRELACDELALSALNENEPQEYGSTILTFLEQFARQQKLPAMAGIAENPSLLRRRITMIAAFKNTKTSFLPAVLILAFLAAITFTSAQNIESTSAGQPELQSVPMTQTRTEADTETASSNVKPVILEQDDGESTGKRSIAGGGHAVFFETGQKSELIAVMLYGSRYGYDQPPKEKFHIWLCDVDQQVIEDFQFPYATFKKGEPRWVKMRVKATELPKRFYLCAGFNPEQTKGVYVHYDGSASGTSYTGLPEAGFSEFEDGDWMIRAVVRPLESTTTASVESSSVAISDLQSMIDTAEAGATIQIPAGTYDQPIKISKSLRLTGSDPEKTAFKVTANEPAIMIDTAGKGPVEISGLTIQWQLASSDKHEMPFAVAIKDTEATVVNCIFRPLGNPQRSPVAINSSGFSSMKVIDCDFEGFDYVVCYGEGTKGTISDCFVRNCGHQGVILYSGAEATIQRNIITGSQYHAVRTTGGKLILKDNLIINNKNRGVYLGNKSGKGVIENNLLIGNATGIDGMSACQFSVVNNVILKSTYAAIAARPYSLLDIQGNVLSDNPRGIIIHQEEGKSDPIRSKFGKNVFWKNQTNMENCEYPDIIALEPNFLEPGNGNFTLTDPAFEGMGLREPKVIFDLWQRYKESK